MDPLNQLFVSNDVTFKVRQLHINLHSLNSYCLCVQCDILSCLTELLRNFAQLEWHRYQKRVEDKQQRFALLMQSPEWRFSIVVLSLSPDRRIFSFSREEEEQEDFDPLLTMKMVVKYVDHLILIALEVRSPKTIDWTHVSY